MTLGVQDPTVDLGLVQGELLTTKNIFCVDTFQLNKAVSQKQSHRRYKARLVLRTADFDGLGLHF